MPKIGGGMRESGLSLWRDAGFETPVQTLYRLENGDFIFRWGHKMVLTLTTNDGSLIKAGYVSANSNWTNPDI